MLKLCGGVRVFIQSKARPPIHRCHHHVRSLSSMSMYIQDAFIHIPNQLNSARNEAWLS